MSAVQQRVTQCAHNDDDTIAKLRHDFKAVGPRWAKRAAEILAQSRPATTAASAQKDMQAGRESGETVNRLTLELFVDLFEGMPYRRG